MLTRILRITLVTLILVPSAVAESRSEVERRALESAINDAIAALAEAEAAAATVYARDLYDEALARLTVARSKMTSRDRDDREEARLAAIESRVAAEAAEAKARLVSSSTEAANLRTDIVAFGGEAIALDLQGDTAVIVSRGDRSIDRVMVAQTAIDRARAAGAELIAAEELRAAEEQLATARRLAKARRESATADHLAYTAEMVARRAEYIARLHQLERYLPGLRVERTRLAQRASELRAAEELRRREQAERDAAALRLQMEMEAEARRMQQEELHRLRERIAENERLIRSRAEEDRLARIEAERNLDRLMLEYEAALAGARSPAEVDRLRRQVEDQRIALEAVQERERISESTMMNEIQRLRTELARERERGVLAADAAAREAELNAQQAEFERRRAEREDAERRRIETEQAYQQKIAESEQRLREAQIEAARLQQEVLNREAELARAKEELARREAEERERNEQMQRTLAEIAETRRDERGLIVTLPGIFFATGKATLQPGARNVLDRIAQELVRNDKLRVTVEGHTDSVGSESSNHELSHKRANAVRDHLVKGGVAESRITSVGRGESAPIATNETAAGRQQNRRVELIIGQKD